MNQLDIDYQNLVRDILENGTTKMDRTKTGTKSVFGRTIRHNFRDGKFPLLTTKKVAFKTMVTELLWFLRGSTNIKYLVDNGCHIWDGDCYKAYRKNMTLSVNKGYDIDRNSLKENENGFSPYTQEEFINKIKTDDEFAKKWGELGPLYGKQWRSWNVKQFESLNDGKFGYKYKDVPIDQIANAIHLLKTDPDSRRNKVSAWNVGEIDQMVLPPCHYSFQFYTRELSLEEKLELQNEQQYFNKHGEPENTPTRALSILWNQRSVDVGLGWSFNVSSYSLLLMMVAKQVNMIPEEVICSLGDCHIYLNHVDGLKEQMTRIPYELPTVKISDRIVNDISEYTIEDFTLENYVHHPAIKLPLSN